jgi:hypothetical protein
MKKTVSININGIFFHIDENAFQVLDNYLETIKSHFAGSEGQDEIIGDIEARIAEIFQSRIDDKNQVIRKEDVDEVIGILGKPEDISGNGSTENGAGFTVMLTTAYLAVFAPASAITSTLTRSGYGLPSLLHYVFSDQVF